MKKLTMLAVGLFVVSATAFAQKSVMVGGAEMYPTKNIIENAVNSKDHTTLVAAVKAAGLVETGNTSKITIMDVNQSNGVIHVIDTVLMP